MDAGQFHTTPACTMNIRFQHLQPLLSPRPPHKHSAVSLKCLGAWHPYQQGAHEPAQGSLDQAESQCPLPNHTYAYGVISEQTGSALHSAIEECGRAYNRVSDSCGIQTELPSPDQATHYSTVRLGGRQDLFADKQCKAAIPVWSQSQVTIWDRRWTSETVGLTAASAGSQPDSTLRLDVMFILFIYIAGHTQLYVFTRPNVNIELHYRY
ncbi:hypothetical protein H112_06485 [Trichophyton rubrum D6]|uniref:Uncharacterized protein n=2 Tax=Trichophyton TaxID=5550 RepID=A0A022VVV0_TRIRU|nr:hypothetical protein H100_06499 [Trichophyton rubrum MR850]EZF50054.1 hypothetical protein H103_06493 [Trichophyton rubrum CBS 288.86]EZF71238.1 hypothetical protein H105_06504 [Trichophyton soudanense CBS 452.61]EZF81932.1 hypothetical protein H110_06488 [Trichophyton rubrum MR1448]EZF92651.1 hypothetical protein H113_06537 [Trichophyton rubrum MR1459]EZG03669.1 hypothetical protein H106_06333 [Trichophyton rubrum CBS 735.88]KDB31114.1 hypothetical protein H112_06485 [Trichophyton rubrum 